MQQMGSPLAHRSQQWRPLARAFPRQSESAALLQRRPRWVLRQRLSGSLRAAGSNGGGAGKSRRAQPLPTDLAPARLGPRARASGSPARRICGALQSRAQTRGSARKRLPAPATGAHLTSRLATEVAAVAAAAAGAAAVSARRPRVRLDIPTAWVRPVLGTTSALGFTAQYSSRRLWARETGSGWSVTGMRARVAENMGQGMGLRAGGVGAGGNLAEAEAATVTTDRRRHQHRRSSCRQALTTRVQGAAYPRGGRGSGVNRRSIIRLLLARREGWLLLSSV